MSVLKYIQLPFHFDVSRLQQEVNELAAGHWQLHYQKLHYEGDWSAIPLRSVGGKADDIIVSPVDDAEYKDTVFLKEGGYIKEVLTVFECSLQAVRLLKLDAGAVIKEHRDAELSYEHGAIRIHIPVITNEEVEFYLSKERMNLKEGECWYMNFNLQHSIQNKSSYDRIHLVIDAMVNEWVTELFTMPGLLKKETEEKGYDDETKRKIIASLLKMNTETANRLADEMEAGIN